MKKPVLRGVKYKLRNGETGLRVWCPFCRRWHEHGWIEGERRPSHRVANCPPESPFYERGYLVAPFTQAEIKEIVADVKAI